MAPPTTRPTVRDESLRQYATERQWEIMEACWRLGTLRAAADELGIKHRAVSQAFTAVIRRAARQGYSPEHDMTRAVPDGYHLQGTSTLYDGTGEIRAQWVKSSIDHERQMEIMREAAEAMAEALPRAKPVKPPKITGDDLMACYPVGDHHMGMYAWHEEAGGDYDLPIAEDLLGGAFDHLIGVAPPCAHSVIALLGDFLHYDSTEPVTPTSKNLLDSDGRMPKMVRATIRSIRYAVRSALQRHAHVRIVVEAGNHDIATAIFLRETLAALYENEPRVEVDTSPRHFHYFRFGKNLVGTHHGHGAKPDQLPMIMATDRPQDWGETTYRFWWTGHIHHKRKGHFGSQEFNGCTVEAMRVLPPTDAWADGRGFRPLRDMQCIVLHREHGEYARHTVNPGMLLNG